MVITIIFNDGRQTIMDNVIQVVNCKHSVSFICKNDESEILFHKDLEGYIVE